MCRNHCCVFLGGDYWWMQRASRLWPSSSTHSGKHESDQTLCSLKRQRHGWAPEWWPSHSVRTRLKDKHLQGVWVEKCEYFLFLPVLTIYQSQLLQCSWKQFHIRPLPAPGCCFLSRFKYLSKSRALKRDKSPRSSMQTNTEDNVLESLRGFWN